MNTVGDKVCLLMDGEIDPGFSVGAGLWLYGTDPGFNLMRPDGTIVLSWAGETGMLSVTTADLRQQEKAAITRAVRAIRHRFTPDWQLWNATRKRSKGIYMLLPVKHFI